MAQQRLLLTLIGLCVVSHGFSQDLCKRHHELECGEQQCECEETASGETVKGPRCYLTVTTPCSHGVCTEDGECQCLGCWEGTHCNVSVNSYAPQFSTEPELVFDIPSSADGYIGDIAAYDRDAERCLQNANDPCECAHVHYSIRRGNDLGLFWINSDTGALFIEAENHVIRPNAALEVEALDGGGKSAVTDVFISFTDGHQQQAGGPLFEHNMVDSAGDMYSSGRKLMGLDESNVAHHRSKRQAGVPAESTFTLEKTGSWASTSDIHVGDRITMQIVLWLPEAEIDVRVEIYTPFESSTIISICTPTVTTVGANFPALKKEEMVAISEARAGDGKYDRSVIDFGTIKHEGTDLNNEAASKITIEFEAVVNNAASFANGDSYSISAGAEYLDKTKVWVAQSTFNGVVNAITHSNPYQVTVTGPSTVMRGDIGVWKVDLTLYDAATEIIMDAYTPLDDPKVMSICRISVGNKGSGFGCTSDEVGTLTFPEVTADNYNSIATFDAGSLVNTMFRAGTTTEADNTITLEVAARMLETVEAVVGDTFQFGVSVEVNSGSIYSAQADVSPSTKTLADGSSNLPALALKTGHSELPWGATTAFQLNITIPASTINSYYVEVALPFNDTAVMSACEARIKSVGFNFPCFDPEAVTFTMESEGNNNENDYIVIDLGEISNSGQRDTDEANTITIQIDATVADSHTVISAGDEVFVTAGVQYGDDMIWVGQTSVTIVDTPTQPANAPSFSLNSMLNRRDKHYLYDRGSSAFYLEMCTEAGTVWPSIAFQVETDLDSDGRAPLEICSAEVKQQGSHIPSCLTSSFPFAYTSDVPAEDTRFGPEVDNHKASLTVPLFSNAGIGDYWTNRNDSCLGVEIIVKANDRVTLVNGTKYWTNVNVAYSSTGSYVAQIAVEYVTEISGTLGSTDDELEFSLEKKRLTNRAFLGGVIDYSLSLYLTPRTNVPVNIEAIAVNGSLSVCRIAVKRRGKNVACSYDALKAAYFSEQNDTYQERGLLDLGHVLDYSQEARTTESRDDDLLELHVAVRLHELGEGTVTQDSSHYTAIAANIADSRLYLAEEEIVAEVDTAFNLVELPKFSLTRLHTTGDLVTRGGGAVYELRMHIPPDSVGNYIIEFFAPLNDTLLGKVSICELRIVSAGWNLPCVHDPFMNHTLVPAADGLSNEAAMLDTGVVGNMANEGDTEIDENLMVAEAQIHLPYDSGAADGDALFLSASVTVGDNLWVAKAEFVVEDDILASEAVGALDLELADNTTVQQSQVGSLTRWGVNIKASQYSTFRTKLRLKMPTGASETVLTVLHSHVSFKGMSWVCASVLDAVYTSQFSTSQADVVEVDLGPITNVDTSSRYQFEDYKDEDDWLTVSFDLQLAQHKDYRDGTSAEFTAEVVTNDDVGADVIKGVTGNVEVVTGAYEEDPDLQFSVDVEEFECANKTQGDLIQATVHFNHTWNSTAHAFNLQVALYVPKYLTYQDFTAEPDEVTPTVTQPTADEGILKFTYTKYVFSDNETLTVNFLIDPAKTEDVSGCIPVALHTQLAWQEADMSNLAGYPALTGDFSSDLSTKELQFTVTPCQDVIHMADCQILASSSHPDFPAEKVKLRSDAGWMSQPRGSPFYKEEFVQGNFGNKTRVTALAIQSPEGDTTNHVSQFYLQYSYAGLRFMDYMEDGTTTPRLFTVSYDGATWSEGDVIFIPLQDGAIVAKSIRFKPQADLDGGRITGVRLAFYGCPEETGVTEADVCGEDFDGEDMNYERGYLVNPDTGHFYLCITANLKWESRCSYSADFGNSWTPIDSRITNIDFYHKVEEQLYGITTRGPATVMRSDDGGDTWFSVPLLEYTNAKSDAGNIVEVKPLTWNQVYDSTASLGLGSWDQLYPTFGTLFNSTYKFSADVSSVTVHQGGEWSVISYWGDKSWDTIVSG